MDDAAAAMLAQILAVQGADVVTADHTVTDVRGFNPIDTSGFDTVVVAFLNGNSKSHARQIVRRLKRKKPSLRVGIVVPMADGARSAQIAPADINADFVSLGLNEAVQSALSVSEPVLLKSSARPLVRPRPRPSPPLVA